MSSVDGKRASEWVTMIDAARSCGVSRNVVQGLANRGAVAVLDIPGSKRRVSLPDVERLIRACRVPAKNERSELASTVLQIAEDEKITA